MQTEAYKDEHLKPLLRSNANLDRIKIYELCAPPLYGIIRKIIPNEKTAEAVLTEVFLTIYQPSFYNQSSNLMLFTRMTNLARKLAIKTIEPLQRINTLTNGHV